MPKPTYPSDHIPALKVPKGGSCCANCKYVSVDKKHCGNDHFAKWHGSTRLPEPADQLCSDWWEPQEGLLQLKKKE